MLVHRSRQCAHSLASHKTIPDRKTPVASGLGADKRTVEETQDDDEFLCGMCNGQDAVFGVEDGAGGEPKVSDEGEQAVRIVPLPTPFQPTLSQFWDHCGTHCPYQPWCPYCVEGRGREFGHSRVTRESSATPTIAIGDAFLSDGEEVEKQEAYKAAGASAVKLPFIRNDKSKAFFGHGVPKKE